MNPSHADFFHQATLRICSSLDIEEASRRCLDYLKDTIPAKAISLLVYDGRTDVMRILSVATPEKALKLSRDFPLTTRGRTLAEWHDDQNVRVVDDLDLDPVGHQILVEAGNALGESYGSLMVMRLEIEGRRFGDVALLARDKGSFTPEQAAFFESLKEPFTIALANYLRHLEVITFKDRLVDENRYLHQELMELSGIEIVGAKTGLKDVMQSVHQVAPLDTPVLLTGETGVGKEVVANAVVRFSSRKDGPFVKVNCGAIPESLTDSELFGHDKGAFTGAASLRRGRFERAHQGTIFLDEISELPHHAQVRLLRVLQNKEIERVGGTQAIPLDIRVIAATNRDLGPMVEAGQFRRDLFFRLNVFPILIPPLRNRLEDVPVMARFFIGKKARQMKVKHLPDLSAETIEDLQRYSWPGNVRELENIVERALIRHRGGPLSFPDLPEVHTRIEPATPPVIPETIPTLDEINRRHIMKALRSAGGKVQGAGGAAEILDIHPNTLRKRMRKLGIRYGRQAK